MCVTQGKANPPAADACYVVRDHDGQALAYVYYEEEPGAAISGQAADEGSGAKDRG